jgi:nucleoredoxin
MQNSEENQFEIVFLSTDHDNAAFRDHFSEMCWPAVPFERSEIIQKLGLKFDVHKIPMLIILNANGEVVDNDARNTINSAKCSVPEVLNKWRK